MKAMGSYMSTVPPSSDPSGNISHLQVTLACHLPSRCQMGTFLPQHFILVGNYMFICAVSPSRECKPYKGMDQAWFCTPVPSVPSLEPGMVMAAQSRAKHLPTLNHTAFPQYSVLCSRPRVAKLQQLGQIWPTNCFYK